MFNTVLKLENKKQASKCDPILNYLLCVFFSQTLEEIITGEKTSNSKDEMKIF